MAFTTLPLAPIAHSFVGRIKGCFLCGASIHHHLVYWDSGQGKLHLHPTCARELGCHLISDSIRAKLAADSERDARQRRLPATAGD